MGSADVCGAARVALVDDHPFVRDQVGDLIRRLKDLELCGEAAGETAAMRLIARHRPDLVIVDLSLEEKSGMSLIERVHRSYPSVALLVLSMQDERLVAERLQRKGARGFVSKRESSRTLVRAVRAVLSGRVWFGCDTARRADSGRDPARSAPRP
jgi:DNA-binding NarL/FixJ family response regulator